MRYVTTSTSKGKLTRKTSEGFEDLRLACELAGLYAKDALLSGDDAEVGIWEESARVGPGQDPYVQIGGMKVQGKKLPVIMMAARKAVESSKGLAALMEGGNLPQLLNGSAPRVVACSFCADGVGELTESTQSHATYKCVSCGWDTSLSPSQLALWRGKHVIREDGLRLSPVSEYDTDGWLILSSFLWGEGGENRTPLYLATKKSGPTTALLVFDGKTARALRKPYSGEKANQHPLVYLGRNPKDLPDARALAMSYLYAAVENQGAAEIEHHDPAMLDVRARDADMFPPAPAPSKDEDVLEFCAKNRGENVLLYLTDGKKRKMHGYRDDFKDGALILGKKSVPLAEIGAIERTMPADRFGEDRTYIAYQREGFTIPDGLVLEAEEPSESVARSDGAEEAGEDGDELGRLYGILGDILTDAERPGKFVSDEVMAPLRELRTVIETEGLEEDAVAHFLSVYDEHAEHDPGQAGNALWDAVLEEYGVVGSGDTEQATTSEAEGFHEDPPAVDDDDEPPVKVRASRKKEAAVA